MDRPTILVTEGSDAAPLAWLRERADVLEVAPEDPGFKTALARAEGLVVRTYTHVNDALLDAAPALKVVGRGGVGLESIDVAACRRRGIEVVYTPEANTFAVADFVFGLMLRLLRPFGFFRDRAPTREEFTRARKVLLGPQLDELTLGILGMGRVGRRVGHIAALGFGMRVIYNDLVDVRGKLDFSATAVDKQALYRESDVLSLHVTMLPGNENLIGAEQLKLMKATSVLINTSRGEVLDANALAIALREKRLAGAAVDVFHPEPPTDDLPLLGMDNVLLTPHLAARTYSAIENMSWVVRDVMAVLEGRKPKFPAPQ